MKHFAVLPPDLDDHRVEGRLAMQSGDHVKVHADGVSVFAIVSIDEDEAVIESVVDAPGRYPWATKLAYLVPVES